MDIHQLRIFSSVFKNRSFTAASEELYLTQPTVSDHIKSLEEELECKLFDRLGRTIVPTREAGVLYGLAVEVIEKMENIRDVLKQLKREISGELLVGASTIPGTYLMPSIMTAFRQKHPSVSFRILIGDSREILEKVVKHEILLGIVGSKLAASQIQYVPFVLDELIVVASPSLIRADNISPEELRSYPVILREEGSGTRRETEKILEHRGISFGDMNVVSVLGSTDAVKQSVKAGLGIAILSRLSVADELKYQTLREIRLDDIQMKRKFYIITHKRRLLPSPYQAFLSFLKHKEPIKSE